MSLRIAIAGLVHETNTYVLTPTVIADFDIHRGSDMRDYFAGTSTVVGGMLAAADELDATVAPLSHAVAKPSGTISRDTYAALRDEIIAAAKAEPPFDILALDLHGAGVADGIDDIEGDLCRRLRATLPERTRIVAAFDLHGNLTQAMADQLSLALGCREYPHVDFFDRGAELIHLAATLVTDALRPRVHVESVPLLLGAGPRTCTRDGATPASAMNELCAELERTPGVLDCTFFHGFAPSDVPFAGASIVAIDDGVSGAARPVAETAAARLWGLRREFEHELPTPAQAVAAAVATAGRPVVLNDVGDNPGGGAPGDCTRPRRRRHRLRGRPGSHDRARAGRQDIVQARRSAPGARPRQERE
jgi:microcystin degradation protein MlrC